jgi:hypothetical protein
MEHTGKGIIKVWKAPDGFHLVKVRGQPVRFPSIDGAVRHVLRSAAGKPHIVQQTIPLSTLKGRCYDIRVMMMRDAGDIWRYSGMLAKVAGPSSIVTNVLRGRGYATTVRFALDHSDLPKNVNKKRLEQDLIRLSYAICRRFNLYKYTSQIGIDFGIDVRGKLWLIEVNFDFPSHALFARLPDQTMYRLIKRRHAEYLRGKRRKQAVQQPTKP